MKTDLEAHKESEAQIEKYKLQERGCVCHEGLHTAAKKLRSVFLLLTDNYFYMY